MSSNPDTRLPKLAVDHLSAEQTELYRSISDGRRAQGPQLFALTDAEGSLEGPFNAMLLRPALGAALQQLGAAVRYETQLSDRCREIAILIVAAHWASSFEQHAHEAIGRSVGLDDPLLAQLRVGAPVELNDPVEQVVADVSALLCAVGDLTDDQYERALQYLGVDGIFELSTLVGYYATLALQLRVFRVAPPA